MNYSITLEYGHYNFDYTKPSYSMKKKTISFKELIFSSKKLLYQASIANYHFNRAKGKRKLDEGTTM